MKKKKLDKRIDEEIETLKGDIRRVRDDLIETLRARRRRGREMAAAGGPEVREVVTEVREQPVRPGESAERPRRRFRVLAIRRSPTWLRVLGASFALGAGAAFLLLRRREVVVAEVPRPRGWRRLGVVLPWRRRPGRVVIRTQRHEPAVSETPSPEREVTVEHEEAPAG